MLVVDDEPIAREGLARMLRQDPELMVLAPCEDGDCAVEVIARERPDLVLLDVQMPELDGFGVIRSLGPAELPAVIFVTAFDEYAIRAFDVAAVDYVLKPVDDARIAEAIRRGKERVRLSSPADQIDRLFRASLDQPKLNDRSAHARRIVIREAGRIVFVPVSEIDWVQGADYYSRLHVGGRSYLIRETMASLADRLDPSRFFRTHRSAIVNLERVREIKWSLRGEGIVLLHSGVKVRLARDRRDPLADALESGPG